MTMKKKAVVAAVIVAAWKQKIRKRKIINLVVVDNFLFLFLQPT